MRGADRTQYLLESEFIRSLHRRSVAFESSHYESVLNEFPWPRVILCKPTHSFCSCVRNFESRGVEGTRKNPHTPMTTVNSPSLNKSRKYFETDPQAMYNAPKWRSTPILVCRRYHPFSQWQQRAVQRTPLKAVLHSNMKMTIHGGFRVDHRPMLPRKI